MEDENNNLQKRLVFSRDATRLVTVNDIRLAYEIHGEGEIPLVLVHGAFESRRTWDWVVPHLADSFRVLIYDMRGYGESNRPSDRVGSSKHVADLAALIEHLELSPAWVAGQSGGGEMALFLAAKRPDLLRGIIAHEPGFVSLLADDPATAPLLENFPQLVAEVIERVKSGDHAGGAKQFVEEGLGEGTWASFPPDFRQDVIDNAENTLDDLNDPEEAAFDLEWLRGFTRPVLLTFGDQTAPIFPPVINKLAKALPFAEIQEIAGAGHPVQAQRPEEFAKAINDFVRRNIK
jgi:pimeloyl-ACP methyl ester carboxylesterase